jgi:hypothetical protein
VQRHLEEAAQEGITRGILDEREQCAERRAQQGTPADSRAVGGNISELLVAAGREVLAGFPKNSASEHHEAPHLSLGADPES